jgi:hypothetical protein
MTPSTADAAASAKNRQEFSKKIRRGLFRPVERHLKSDLREDQMQEALGHVYKMYDSYARERGVVLDDAILVHACRLRACDPGRRLAGAAGARPRGDVYDHRNYRDGKLELLRLDIHQNEDRPEEDMALGLPGLALPGAADPSDAMNSAHDLAKWLGELSADERRLLALRQSGHGLVAIGKKLKITSSTAFQRSRRLGAELAERAGISVEKKRRGSRVPRHLPPAVRDALERQPAAG